MTVVGAGPLSDQSIDVTSNSNVTKQPFFIIAIVSGVAGLFLIIIIVLRIRRRRHNEAGGFDKPKPDEWEYDPIGLTLGMKLGEGNFGIVTAATAMNVQRDLPGATLVAVKMCNDKATVQDKKDFIAEANLMKKFSKPWHQNVCINEWFLSFLLTYT